MTFWKNLFKKEAQPHLGIYLFEWVMVVYTVLTLFFIAGFYGRLPNSGIMIGGRVLAVLLTVVLWQIYRHWPNRFMLMLRVVLQMVLLSQWYPDTYEMNRIFASLDHLFATWEQALFGCQPALLFSQVYSSPVVSELLSLGYVSYYPMIGAVCFWYFIYRYDRFPYASYVILGSFFLFYIVFVCLPVAGPQFYFQAVGLDSIARGVFPDIGHYFLNHQESLTIPGYHDGMVYHVLQMAHDAGERPTAAFPSSHVGVSVVLLWLAWEVRGYKLLWVLVPLSVLMFFATFYIQAHYAIDAIAGLFAGTLFYFLLRWAYDRIGRP